MKKIRGLFLFLLIFFICSYSFANDVEEKKDLQESISENVKSDKNTPEEDETIQFSADKMFGVANDSSDFTQLIGNAKIITNSMEISADSVELSGKDFRFVKAIGNVKGINTDDGLEFSCNSMDYDRTEKIAFFYGNVKLDDKKNEVVADAQRIEYREKNGLALMQMNVKIVQKESVCTCAYAIYRKNQQQLEMTGNPQVVRGKDTFRAQEILFNLETEEITLDGRVRGTVTSSSEKKEENNGTN